MTSNLRHAHPIVLAACLALAACEPASSGDDDVTPTPGTAPIPFPESFPTGGTTQPLCPADPASLFPVWINGLDCGSEPDIQVHRYDENTWILRQSMCTNFEGPFLYLMFGNDKVLLEDTGAGGIAIQAAVQSIVDLWLTEHAKASIELVVVNSHAHGDHTAGNTQFAGQPNTSLVGTSVANVSTFFGISAWPTEIVPYDLGGRVIDVIPIPGHQTSHIALYDHATGNLLTGDTLYPGRLYIQAGQFPVLQTSIQRLVDFTAGKEVCNVLGTHIEMSNTPGDDYPFASTMHADEHPLRLTRATLLELSDGVMAMNPASPQNEVHDDFIISP